MRCLFYIGQFLFFTAGMYSVLPAQEEEDRTCEALFEFYEVLEENHISPPSKNEAWASILSDLYIEALDPEAKFFTLDDLETIKELEQQILLDWGMRKCNYSEKVGEILKTRLGAINEKLESWKANPFTFSPSDTLFWSPLSQHKRGANLTEQWSFWEKQIKYKLLLSLQEEFQPISSDRISGTAFKRQIELLENAQCEIQDWVVDEDYFKQYYQQKFMEALSASYDPHSTYFSLSEKELWDLALSSQAYSFGLEFEKNRQGQLQISRLKPGGAGWKSQRLHQGDAILEIEYPMGNFLDLNCLSIVELAEKLKSSASDFMKLKIQKKNGEIHEFRLNKEKVEQKENILSSYVLEGLNKVGYLYLPAFYTESEDDSRGCADDVAKELLRLQAEGIEGLILDLRFNGGGSMKEAINLAGIFIDKGPLAIYEERDKDPTLLRDVNRGSFYDGPLIIMINGNSASASEILASALQDYKRAVIVGSKSFGKSSGQIMLPVVGVGLGMAKVSIQKYYRINGESYQSRGIIPDVVLPNIDELLGEKESDHIQAFSHRYTDKKISFETSGEFDYAYLQTKSKARLSEHPSFQSLEALIRQGKDWEKKKLALILHPAHYYKGLKKQINFARSLEMKKKVPSSHFETKNNRFVASLLKLEPEKQALNQEQLDKISQDLYLEETYQIMKDLIQTQKN